MTHLVSGAEIQTHNLLIVSLRPLPQQGSLPTAKEFKNSRKCVCPSLVVMGGDSCSEGHEFDSKHCMLDGHFFTWICCIIVLMFVWKRPKINGKEAGMTSDRPHSRSSQNYRLCSEEHKDKLERYSGQSSFLNT